MKIDEKFGSKFSVIIVTEQYGEMTLIDRQREVNNLILNEEIHSLEMKTWNPA